MKKLNECPICKISDSIVNQSNDNDIYKIICQYCGSFNISTSGIEKNLSSDERKKLSYIINMAIELTPHKLWFLNKHRP